MATDNPYAELGLSRGATEAEVKAAWRRLVSQWHPDRNPSGAAVGKMQRINHAFEQLRGSGFTDTPPTADESERTPRADAARARDEAAEAERRTVRRKLRLTLEEAAAGCIKMVRGKLTDSCVPCSGAGFRWPGGACTACFGNGSVRERSWYGWFGTTSRCEACAGDGVARVPCPTCDGSGKLATRPYRIAVRIPPGVRNSDVLQVDSGRARAGHVQVKLDLHINVLPHALFTLDDDGTVRCELPVDGFAWIAQRTVEVPTLNGSHALGLRRDRLSVRVPGQGFPVGRRGSRGDMVVNLLPTFPERFSTDQNILIDQLIATNGTSADSGARASVSSTP